MVRIAPFAHLPMVPMGDFNAVLDSALDSSNPNTVGSFDLNNWSAVAGLKELWCWKHPTATSLSHVSTAHRSSARIDLAFGNESLLSFVTDKAYLPGGLSDHNPLFITLTFPTGRRGGDGGSPLVGCNMNKSLPN